MQTVAPVARSGSTDAANTMEPSAARLSQAALSENFDTFLNLLTAQLRNQDPLNPMDPTQFVSQLTQFSELEQSIAQSRSLEETVAALHDGAAKQNLAYLGRTVSVESSDIMLGDEGATFAYIIDQPAENMAIRIFDSSDRLVAELPVAAGATQQTVEWDGLSQDGTPASKGAYHAELVSVSDSGAQKAGRIILNDRVSEVRFANGQTRLLLDGGVVANADAVISAAMPG